jgi:hypothetical protein
MGGNRTCLLSCCVILLLHWWWWVLLLEMQKSGGGYTRGYGGVFYTDIVVRFGNSRGMQIT